MPANSIFLVEFEDAKNLWMDFHQSWWLTVFFRERNWESWLSYELGGLTWSLPHPTLPSLKLSEVTTSPKYSGQGG